MILKKAVAMITLKDRQVRAIDRAITNFAAKLQSSYQLYIDRYEAGVCPACGLTFEKMSRRQVSTLRPQSSPLSSQSFSLATTSNLERIGDVILANSVEF